MAEKEQEIESVDASSANIDSNANVDAEAVSQAEAGQATPAPAAPAPATPAPAPAATKVAAPPKEKPKTMREKTDELFTRVLMGRDKEINNLLNKWGRDKFHKLITENPKFREDFYKDISGRGISIPVDEYRGYYTPEYEQQKNIVYSDEGVKQIREQEQQRQKEAKQADAEIAQAKNEPWYRSIPEALGMGAQRIGNDITNLLNIATEAAGKNAVTKSLGVDKFLNYVKDNVTNVQRGGAFGEAINETNLAGLATGSTNFDFERIAKQMKDVKSYGTTNIELDFQKHEGGWDTVSDYAKMLVPTILESGATLMRSGWEETLAAAGVGAPEVGGLIAAYHMELFATIVDELEKNHYDVTKGEDWRKAFNNKDFINPVLEKANTRAAIITGFDMLGAGIFGNVGGTVARQAKKVAEKVMPKALTSSLGKALSTVGQSKKILSHPSVRAVKDRVMTVAQQAAATKGGKAVATGVKELKEFLNPQEAAAAYGGEATAQLVTTGKVNQEEAFLETGGEFGVIKVLSRLLKRGGRTLGRAVTGASTPQAAPAPGAQPPAGTPPAEDYVEVPVDDAEYEAYQRDKTLHPDRRLAVEEDAVKALDDPAYLEKLKKDASEDESMRRYFEMVSDAMEKETKYREAEEIMKASIAHASELYGGISEEDMAQLIDPNSTRYNKDIANTVENKYAELMDAYASETGDDSFRQTRPQAPAAAPETPVSAGTTETTPQAPDTSQLPVEVRKSVDAIQRLQDYLARLEAAVPQMSPEDLRKYEATKKSVEEVIEKNKQTLTKLGYDSKNLTGISGQVGVGQESQQAQPQQGGGTQEAGGSGVFQAPGQEVAQAAQEGADEIQGISDEVRALAAQELNPKKLVKDGTLVYKNRKPVYNGQQFNSTKELEAFLQTDEAILAAAESNEAIANALGKTATFTPTTATGVGQETTTGQAGPSAESVAGTQTAEGATEAASAESTTQQGKGQEVLPEELKSYKKGDKIQWDVYGNQELAKWNVEGYTKTSKGKDAIKLTKEYVEDLRDGKTYSKEYADANGIKYDKDNTYVEEHIVTLEHLKTFLESQAEGQKTKPEGKPRVKGDSQEVIEAFEKAVAAGKKISFPVSGGRTTVQLDKPGQLKAAEDGELYIDRGKGKREYLPAGGSEESVIRQQLGVAETAESQKQRKEAVAERNKKAKEREEQKKKEEQEKQTKQKRDYIARLQKVLDTGKDEKGNPINQRQRKEAEKTIERLKQSIAEAEAAEKLVKGEQPVGETQKQPQTKAQEKLQLIIENSPKGKKGTFLIAGDNGGPKIGDQHNTGNIVLVKESILAKNFDPKIADNDGDGVEVYEMIREYGERENGKLSKAPVVRIMIFNNQEDADAYFKEKEAKSEQQKRELQEEVDKEKAGTKPESKKETQKPEEKPSQKDEIEKTLNNLSKDFYKTFGRVVKDGTFIINNKRTFYEVGVLTNFEKGVNAAKTIEAIKKWATENGLFFVETAYDESSKADKMKFSSEKPEAKPSGLPKEIVGDKTKAISQKTAQKIADAFAERFGINVKLIDSKQLESLLSNDENAKDFFFKVIDQIDVFDSDNIQEAKDFITSIFQTVESAEDAKKAYRKLAVKYHPDKRGSEEVMKHLNDVNDKYQKGTLGSRPAQQAQPSQATKEQKYREWAERMSRQYEAEARAAAQSSQMGDEQRAREAAKAQAEKQAREAKAAQPSGAPTEKQAQPQQEKPTQPTSKIKKGIIESMLEFFTKPFVGEKTAKAQILTLESRAKYKADAFKKRNDLKENYRKTELKRLDENLKNYTRDVITTQQYRQNEAAIREEYRKKNKAVDDWYNQSIKIIDDAYNNKTPFVYRQYIGDKVAGIYDPITLQAYVNVDNIDDTTFLHEAFSHPFIEAVKERNEELYNNLLSESKNEKEIVDYVNEKYGDAPQQIKDAEYIARAIDLDAKGKLKNKTLAEYIKEFWGEATKIFKDIFQGKEAKIENIGPQTRISDIVDFVLKSGTKLDLSKPEPAAPVKTETKDDAAIKKRIEALDPNESQGYQIDRLRAVKEDMLRLPERAMMAMRAMDFFTEFYSKTDKKYAEYVEKHPLSTVTQYFYSTENSIYGMVTEQIAGKQFDIVRKEQQISMLGKGKKDAGIKKSYEDDIQSAKKYIDDLIEAYNKYAAENKYVPFNINGRVVPSTIGRDQNGRGDLKKIPYEFTLNQFSDKVKESIKNGTFKIEVEKSGTKAVAKFIKSGKVLKIITLPDISKIKETALQDYATDQLINTLHKDSVLLAVTVQDGDSVSQFEQDIKMRRMSAQDAVQIISSANVEVPKGIQALADSEKEILQETAEPEAKTETAPEIEQYKPLTSKDIEIGKFSKDEALDYETDEKELDSGRMSEYISSMTVDVMDENGDSVGNLIRLKDEDGITSYQATDFDGNELTEDSFDTKQEAIQAILDAYNKQKGKEFAAEQKRKAKAEEKKAAKEAAKQEKAEPVTPISPEVVESTAESVTDSQMKMIDDIMETERTKPAKAKEMREQFIEMHGKEVFDKLNKITRNFEQIISTLEKEGKCTKKC